MRRRNSRVGVLILFAAAALVAAFLIYIFLSQQNNQNQQVAAQQQQVSVIRAKADIPAFTILSAENVESVPVDQNTIPEADRADLAQNGGDVVGMMTTRNLQKGQNIRKSYLSQPGLSNIIPYASPTAGGPTPTPANTNRRAISLPVNDESGVGGQISNDDYIDIYWTQRYQIQVDETQPVAPGAAPIAPARKQYTFNSTKLILQGIHVLQVIQLSNPPVAGAVPRHQLNPNQTQLLILDVTPQEAEVVKYMRDTLAVTGAGDQAGVTEQVGSAAMTIVLRARGDTRNDATTNTLGVTEPYMITTYGIRPPGIVTTPITGQRP
jgi:Flp pilus assembly protein CpaB